MRTDDELRSWKHGVDEPDRTVGRALLYPMPAVTESGVVGTPTRASAGRGAELFDRLVAAFVDLLRTVRSERDPELAGSLPS